MAADPQFDTTPFSSLPIGLAARGPEETWPMDYLSGPASADLYFQQQASPKTASVSLAKSRLAATSSPAAVYTPSDSAIVRARRLPPICTTSTRPPLPQPIYSRCDNSVLPSVAPNPDCEEGSQDWYTNHTLEQSLLSTSAIGFCGIATNPHDDSQESGQPGGEEFITLDINHASRQSRSQSTVSEGVAIQKIAPIHIPDGIVSRPFEKLCEIAIPASADTIVPLFPQQQSQACHRQTQAQSHSSSFTSPVPNTITPSEYSYPRVNAARIGSPTVQHAPPAPSAPPVLRAPLASSPATLPADARPVLPPAQIFALHSAELPLPDFIAPRPARRQRWVAAGGDAKLKDRPELVNFNFPLTTVHANSGSHLSRSSTTTACERLQTSLQSPQDEDVLPVLSTPSSLSSPSSFFPSSTPPLHHSTDATALTCSDYGGSEYSPEPDPSWQYSATFPIRTAIGGNLDRTASGSSTTSVKIKFREKLRNFRTVVKKKSPKTVENAVDATVAADSGASISSFSWPGG